MATMTALICRGAEPAKSAKQTASDDHTMIPTRIKHPMIVTRIRAIHRMERPSRLVLGTEAGGMSGDGATDWVMAWPQQALGAWGPCGDICRRSPRSHCRRLAAD